MIRSLFRLAVRTFRRKAATPALLLGLSLATAPAFAGGLQGLSYSIMPGVDYVQWNNKIGLKDDTLYGGRLGLNFGRYVALRGFYFFNSEIGIEAPEGVEESDLGFVDVANYGADLVLQFPRGSVLPFVYGGGGIYRFDPDGGERIKKIGLKAGAGLRFALTERAEASIYVEDAMVRPGSGFVTGKEVDGTDLEHNTVIGASLNFFLGGYSGETDADRELQNKFSGGITGASWKIEPFAGKLAFDDEVNLADNEVVGVRTGIGFGPFVDLRGFYWRGVESDFGKTEQIQSYGLETQFNLNPSPGVEPHLLLGVGNIDFMDKFEDPDGAGRDDEMVLIAGGGISFTLADRWRVNVDARDYMFSRSDLDETGSPDDLFHNWMYTAGLTFSLGGRADARKAKVQESFPAPAPVAAAPAKTVEPPLTEAAGVESVAEEKKVSKELADTMASPVRTYQGDRVVTIPVPTVGEIYVRYGDPGGVTIETKTNTEATPTAVAPATPPAASSGDLSMAEEESIRKAIRAVLREEVGGARDSSRPVAPSGTDSETLAQIEERLMKKIDGRIEQRVRQEERPAAPAWVAPAPPQPASSAPPATAGPARGFMMREVQGYSGASIDEPNQWILGARLPLLQRGSTWPVYWVPELAFGLLEENSTLLAANLVYDLGGRIEVNGVRPYVGAGAGILFFKKKIGDREKREGVLNLSYGLSKGFGKYNAFIEHQGIDLFSLHRVIAGVGWEL